MQKENINSFAQILNNHGIDTSFLSKYLCNQRDYKLQENKSDYDLFSNAYKIMIDSVEKHDIFNIHSSKEWKVKNKILKAYSSKASEIINSTCSLRNEEKYTLKFFKNSDISNKDTKELKNNVTNIIVPAVMKYYNDQKNLIDNKNNEQIFPWDYDILDFCQLNAYSISLDDFKNYLFDRISYSMLPFFNELKDSDLKGFMDLRKYKGKTNECFSVYCDALKHTFISISPSGNIRDCIYFTHEIGHSLFNYICGHGTNDFSLISLYNTESIAYHFENSTINMMFNDNDIYSIYIYEKLSGICLNMLHFYFDRFCIDNVDSTSEQKALCFNHLTKLFTPWVNGIDDYNYFWIFEFQTLTEPFYDFADALSQINSISIFNDSHKSFEKNYFWWKSKIKNDHFYPYTIKEMAQKIKTLNLQLK